MKLSRMAISLALAIAPSTFGAAVYSGLAPGSSSLGPGDDIASPSTAIGFNVNFFGTTYSNLFVNNNGNVTFGGNLLTHTPFGLTTATARPIIAPFFADVDTRVAPSGRATYGATTFTTNDAIVRNAFVGNWLGVGYYSGKTDKLNSFQMVLVDRGSGDFDIVFNYDGVLWEAGDASGGVNGFGGTSARVGYSAGSGTPGTFAEFVGSGVNGAFQDGGPSGTSLIHNSNVPLTDPLYTRTDGRYVMTVRNGVVSGVETPEPTTFALAGGTLVLLGFLRKHRA